MGLRARLAVLLVAAVVPFAVLLAVVQGFLLRRHAALATGEALRAQLDDDLLARCEEDPARFAHRFRGDGPPDGRPHRRRAMHRRGERQRGPRPGRLFALDADLAPARPDAPRLPAPMAEDLRRGEDVAWSAIGPGLRRDELLVAVRVADAGSCTYVLAARRVEAQPLVVTLGPALAVSAFAALLVTLAAGPLVRRIRRLTAAVRRARAGEDVALPVEGADELTELAEALVLDRTELAAKVDALRRRDEALTRFVANTTHDVMIPLTVLQNHLIDLEAASAPGSEPRAAAERALGEAHYLGSLLQNLGAAAKLDAVDRPIERVAVDLAEVVARVAERHAPLARKKGIGLEHAVPERLLVVADLTLVERALSNLVHNAVRYGEPGGHVAVVLDRAASEGSGFRVDVIDDGPGVPDADLARLGERRFRSDAARSRKPAGSGLGLAIAREVAERHGWTLSFAKNEPRGLRVTITGS